MGFYYKKWLVFYKQFEMNIFMKSSLKLHAEEQYLPSFLHFTTD